MTPIVFVAVIGAAMLHALWNAAVKGGTDKRMGIIAVMTGHIPAALLCLFFVPLPAPESLPYLIVGIVLHLGYQFFLMNSYRLGDLTQVYPIARGSAPLIVAAVSVFALGVALSGAELLAILMIALGIISLALVRRADGLRNHKAALFALITGCFIASYSLVDGYGARAAGTAVGFYSWLGLGNSAVLVLYCWWKIPTMFRDIASRGKFMFFVGGTASFVAYAMVTWAFTQAPIALVTALREVSIIFALLIGVLFLKERISLAKVFSTAMTLGGVILLRLGKG